MRRAIKVSSVYILSQLLRLVRTHIDFEFACVRGLCYVVGGCTASFGQAAVVPVGVARSIASSLRKAGRHHLVDRYS
jgi:hypothetical protein